jgi:Phosphatidylinositolglycan class N (PIG-N).
LKQAIRDSDDLIQLGLEGLRYLQTYDWLFLRALVTAGDLGWIMFPFTTALKQHFLNTTIKAHRTVVGTLASADTILRTMQQELQQTSPYQYYVYAVFPALFWNEVVAQREIWIRITKVLLKQASAKDMTAMGLNTLALCVILEVVVSSP